MNKHWLGLFLGGVFGAQAIAADMVQTCLDGVTVNNPSSDFTINGDGTVTHQVTGLTWRQCAVGLTWSGSACTGTADYKDWEGALAAAESLSFAGKSDWRLPNINELRSLVERACATPATNAALFPMGYDVAYRFLSSTSFFTDSRRVRFIDMATGEENMIEKDQYFTYMVVRGGN